MGWCPLGLCRLAWKQWLTTAVAAAPAVAVAQAVAVAVAVAATVAAVVAQSASLLSRKLVTPTMVEVLAVVVFCMYRAVLAVPVVAIFVVYTPRKR